MSSLGTTLIFFDRFIGANECFPDICRFRGIGDSYRLGSLEAPMLLAADDALEFNSGVARSSSVATAGTASFAIDSMSGQIWGFGPNSNGELGDGTSDPSPPKLLTGIILGRNLTDARVF